MKWRKFNGETINLPIYDAVENVIRRESTAGYRLKVCIGTDSQVKGQETEFATVIVFLREGHGGFMGSEMMRTLSSISGQERYSRAISKDPSLLCFR